jgi:hypothetical protein
MKLWARFRRWLHLIRCLFTLRYVFGEDHRAMDSYPRVPTRILWLLGKRSIIEISCACGKSFWHSKPTHHEGNRQHHER